MQRDDFLIIILIDMVVLKSILFVIGAIIALIAIAGTVMMLFHVLSMCAHDKDCDNLASADDVDIPESAEEYRIGIEEPYDVINPARADEKISNINTNPNDDGQGPDGNAMTAELKQPVKKKIRRKKKAVVDPVE